ncbi:hypothetical protein IWQ60_005353 [Tieghemiomyces parasiticus]|uniref:Uncharacterized protein n=1 Tax=Tieghemiomyces parasiticus TaxID=78921 RepID=A0A9W8DT49_9FUNG|nr:hypothetical protein IWQ60_005353 [Tieghemiomyces parasiticus]
MQFKSAALTLLATLALASASLPVEPQVQHLQPRSPIKINAGLSAGLGAAATYLVNRGKPGAKTIAAKVAAGTFVGATVLNRITKK